MNADLAHLKITSVSAVMSTTDKGEPCFVFVQIKEPALRSQANMM